MQEGFNNVANMNINSRTDECKPEVLRNIYMIRNQILVELAYAHLTGKD